ncbi:MAG: hypothetical protein V4622_00330 [Bacteroidota bacterium]
MKVPILVCFLCLFQLFTFAQSEKKIKKYHIKSITEEKIDSSKTSIESIVKYDKNANIIFEEEYSKSGKFKAKYSQKFNKYDKVEEQVIYNEKGTVSQTILTKYNLDLPILITILNEKGELSQTIEIKYNGLKEKMEEITSDSKGLFVQKVVYEYDKKGLKTSKKTFDKNNKLIETKKYTYEF